MQGEHQPLLMAGAQPSAAAAPGDYSGESRVAKAIGSIPPGVLGLALGLSGLAGVWVCAARFLVEPGLFDEALPIIVWILLVPAAVLILLYGSKSIFAPAVAERELLSAAGNSSLATGTMATMSIALMLHGQGVIMPAKILWFLGMLAHVTFLLIFSVRHLRFLYLPEKLEELTPSWVIPPIGIAIATSTGLPLVGGWVVVFFWFGLGAFCIIFPIAVYRSFFLRRAPLPEAVTPQLAILTAPAALLFAQWVDMGGDKDSALSHFLGVVEVSAVLLVLTRIPKVVTLPFSPIMASLTFPSDILAKATIRYCMLFDLGRETALQAVMWVLVVFSTGVVSFVTLLFIRHTCMPLFEHRRASPPEGTAIP